MKNHLLHVISPISCAGPKMQGASLLLDQWHFNPDPVEISLWRQRYRMVFSLIRPYGSSTHTHRPGNDPLLHIFQTHPPSSEISSHCWLVVDTWNLNCVIKVWTYSIHGCSLLQHYTFSHNQRFSFGEMPSGVTAVVWFHHTSRKGFQKNSSFPSRLFYWTELFFYRYLHVLRIEWTQNSWQVLSI